jgi:ribosome-associated toxin RatA of RatAB toxin-antitoxin module
MDKEKLILKLMKECEADGEPITREEAEEMAEMEIKAKGLDNYTQSTVEKKPKKKREVKKDQTKIAFLKILEEWLTNANVSDIILVNEQREISFKMNNDTYSLVLTKHRPPKKGV